jgi:serine/threonine protein kinase
MAIPDEYTIEEVIHKAGNVKVCQADHPIHERVIIYMPDDAVPSETVGTIKRYLYRSGIQMRSISQLSLPFVTRTIEVSQDPSEPYIVTEYTKYDLEELINSDIKLKPKRIYQIFSQVLEAVESLEENGWQIECLNPYQIKLSDIQQGNVTFTAIGSSGPGTNITKTVTTPTEGKPTDTLTVKAKKDLTSAPPENVTVAIDETETLENVAATEGPRQYIESTVTLSQGKDTINAEKQLRLIQRNIYILGGIAYQLLFGEKFHLSDNTAAANIEKLGSKWRTVLDKSLSPNLEDRYESYEAMLCDIKRVLLRNKKIAIGVAPLMVLLLMGGMLLSYNMYHRRKIMTSEAGQAIKSFLSIVDKTESEFPEPYNPGAASREPNDNTILKPFDEITTAPAKED